MKEFFSRWRDEKERPRNKEERERRLRKKKRFKKKRKKEEVGRRKRKNSLPLSDTLLLIHYEFAKHSDDDERPLQRSTRTATSSIKARKFRKSKVDK